jgi:hypothetical protein
MTPKDHNKTIGILHLVWGALNALAMSLLVPFIIILLGPMGSDPTPRLGFGSVYRMFIGLIVVLSLVFSTPPLVAGYAMLRRRSWGRVAGIVSACFTAFSVPFGTALTLYTLWFLCGRQGEQFYRKAGFEAWRPSLRDGSAFDWEAQRTADAARRGEYVAPTQPPDWRS